MIQINNASTISDSVCVVFSLNGLLNSIKNKNAESISFLLIKFEKKIELVLLHRIKKKTYYIPDGIKRI
jgi:hypothetical protein